MASGGAKWQVVFEADGAFVAREEVIPMTSLPTVVRDAVKAKYPKATLHAAEKITRATTTEYEVGDCLRYKSETKRSCNGGSAPKPPRFNAFAPGSWTES